MRKLHNKFLGFPTVGAWVVTLPTNQACCFLQTQPEWCQRSRCGCRAAVPTPLLPPEAQIPGALPWPECAETLQVWRARPSAGLSDFLPQIASTMKRGMSCTDASLWAAPTYVNICWASPVPTQILLLQR